MKKMQWLNITLSDEKSYSSFFIDYHVKKIAHLSSEMVYCS